MGYTDITPVEELIPVVTRVAKGLAKKYPYLEEEDVVQEALLALVQSAKRYDRSKGASLCTYAGRRAVGAIIDLVRSNIRHSVTVYYLEERPPREGLRERSMESRETILRFRRFLATSIGRLPRRQRQVVELRFFQGLSVRETARRLGISTTTAAREQRQALFKLRDAFLRTRAETRTTGIKES